MHARASIWTALLSLSLAACTSLTEPGPPAPTLELEQATPAPAPAPTPAAPTPPPAEPQIAASHILIAYKGALRANQSITRSKEDAQRLAAKVQAQAKAGADFGALAEKYSDDPSAKVGKGSLGKFYQRQMVKPFADAAFALKVGEVSAVVETPFGFHVIKRTE